MPDTTYNLTLNDIGFNYIRDRRPERLNWSNFFGNDNPVEVEFGCGTGRFILDSATRRPDVNFLGVEVAGKWFRLVAKRILKRRLTNVRLLQADARDVAKTMIPPESVENYYIQFPDPWPKKRHHKRRIFQPEFCGLLKNGLKPGGHVHIMTDVDYYFDYIVRNMDGFSQLVKLDKVPDDPERIITNYEEKALTQNVPIYKISYQKPH